MKTLRLKTNDVGIGDNISCFHAAAAYVDKETKIELKVVHKSWIFPIQENLIIVDKEDKNYEYIDVSIGSKHADFFKGLSILKKLDDTYHSFFSRIISESTGLEFKRPIYPKQLKYIKPYNCGQKYVVINPFTSVIEKNWSPFHFSRLILRLHSIGIKVIIICEEVNKEIANSMICSNNVDLLVDRDQEFIASLIYNSELYIGCDSGLTHLSISLNKPTICIASQNKWDKITDKKENVFGVTPIDPCYGCRFGYDERKQIHIPIHKEGNVYTANCLRLCSVLQTISPESIFIIAKQILAK